MTTPEIAPKNALASKLAHILGEVGRVAKSGRNSFHNYDYVTENDLVYAVRDKLAAAGIFVFTSVEHQAVEFFKDEEDKKISALTTITTKHTFIDGESGEQFSVLSQGQGADVGDKGGYKAITGAMKYFLYKCFMIPTGDDPEGDESTDRSAQERPAASTQRSTAGSAAEQRREPQVPRDAGVQEIAKFEELYTNNRWEKAVIHIGTTYKGKTLFELTASALSGWFKWTPKPYGNKPISEPDMKLRAALNVAERELAGK